MPRAPERFVDWTRGYIYLDRNKRLPAALQLQYHSRSDAHSKQLCEFVVDDLLETCELIREHAAKGRLVYGINYPHAWPNGKRKTLDLAIGLTTADVGPPSGRIHKVRRSGIRRVLISLEAKTTATEHHKSEPRAYSELNDAHTIVHQGSRDTIATGINVINIATTFVSPLRQRPDQPIKITHHNQPAAAASMVEHLRKLPRRRGIDDVGLDAYTSVVIDMNNQGHVELWTAEPAPQPGGPDHYDTFLADICRAYAERYGDLDGLPEEGGLSVEESLRALGTRYPGLLTRAGEAVVQESSDGAAELHAILQTLDSVEPRDVSE